MLTINNNTPLKRVHLYLAVLWLRHLLLDTSSLNTRARRFLWVQKRGELPLDAASHCGCSYKRHCHSNLLNILLHQLNLIKSPSNCRLKLSTTGYLHSLLRILRSRAIALPHKVCRHFYFEATAAIFDRIPLHFECNPYSVRFPESDCLVDNVCILCNSVHHRSLH